jgi:type I restriction enzyme S subunit
MIVDPNAADYRYLYYTLLNDRDRIVDRANGAAQQNLSARTIRNLHYRFPPIKEQRAIAATLGALDDKIESNRRTAFLISDLLDTYSEKFGAGLPTVPLGDIATPVKKSLNPSNLGNTQVDHFSLPAFDRDARPERVAASSIMSNKLRVPKQAILLSRLNPRFNRTWWASADADAPALASTEFFVLTAEDEQRLAAVWLALRDPFFRGEMPKRVTGTSGSHQRVKPDDVLAIEVPDFTSAPTVLKEAALAMLKRSENLRAESARLSALRDALLPELLSGRLRAPVGTT